MEDVEDGCVRCGTWRVHGGKKGWGTDSLHAGTCC